MPIVRLNEADTRVPARYRPHRHHPASDAAGVQAARCASGYASDDGFLFPDHRIPRTDPGLERIYRQCAKYGGRNARVRAIAEDPEPPPRFFPLVRMLRTDSI